MQTAQQQSHVAGALCTCTHVGAEYRYARRAVGAEFGTAYVRHIGEAALGL